MKSDLSYDENMSLALSEREELHDQLRALTMQVNELEADILRGLVEGQVLDALKVDWKIATRLFGPAPGRKR